MNRTELVNAWPTPASRDMKGANGADRLENGTGRLHLDQLPNFVAHIWATPRSSDGAKGGPNMTFGAGGTPLPAMAIQMWFTPNVPNGGRSLAPETSDTGVTKDGKKRQVGLENQAKRLVFSRQPPETLPHGRRSPTMTTQVYLRYRATTDLSLRSERRWLLRVGKRGRGEKIYGPEAKGWSRSRPEPWVRPAFRRSLNAVFVAWLMGWPRGWTNCACSATALSRWKQAMRSELLALPLPSASMPRRQTSMLEMFE